MKKQITYVLFLLFILLGCMGEKMSAKNANINSIENVSTTAWEKLSKKSFYFGHQSVGNNIMAGMQDILNENPQIKLTIMESRDPGITSSGFFIHSRIGKNHEPLTKSNDFYGLMKQGFGNRVDFAFFKLCYVDIPAGTNIEELFSSYKKGMSILKKLYPETTFIHVTSPVTVVQPGIKAVIKKIMGRPPGGYEANITRNKYNELLRQEYADKEPIFDIAMVEATYMDGSTERFRYKGREYYALIPEYTHDGRHLNEKGRKRVAEELLVFLARLAEKEN